jgi:hypothetical protein
VPGRRTAEDLKLVTQHQDLDILVEGVLASQADQFDGPTDSEEEERECPGETIAPVLDLVKPGG